MTISMNDVRVAATKETHLGYRDQVGQMKTHRRSHWVDWAVGVILWGGVLMGASGLGLLLEAIVDTVRYGHPR